jgi:carbonic anhydrase/acetyltransferase-like protein (isoleucine patch superfamily)
MTDSDSGSVSDSATRTFPVHPDMAGRVRRRGGAFVADDAAVVGDVRLGTDVSIWFHVTIRGDDAPIAIGEASNVQDNSCLHADPEAPLVIGKGVTIGHGAIVHGVEVGDYALIGMGSIVLGGARIGACSIIGAGALVRENMVVPPRSVVLGVPGRIVREVTGEEVAAMHRRAQHYVARAASYLQPSDR